MLILQISVVMKPVGLCEWVPYEVAAWFTEELNKKGAPGRSYSHTLFSLLHTYFCPHPISVSEYYSSKCLDLSKSLNSSLGSGLCREFDHIFDKNEENIDELFESSGFEPTPQEINTLEVSKGLISRFIFLTFLWSGYQRKEKRD